MSLGTINLLTIVVICIDLLISVLSFVKRTREGVLLGTVMLLSAVICGSYNRAALTQSYLATSWLSAVEFACIDALLVCFVVFTLVYTNYAKLPTNKILLVAAIAYCCFDLLVQLTNPISGISIAYFQGNASELVTWGYIKKPLFMMHLAYCYMLICWVTILLVYRAITVPRTYRFQYISVAVGVLIVVALNAIFLVQDFANYDMSVLAYSVMGLYLYWVIFHVHRRNSLERTQQMVLNRMTHPIVLFDFEGNVSSMNDRAKKFFPTDVLGKDVTLKQFLDSTGMDEKITDLEDDRMFNFLFSSNSGQTQSFRVEYQCLKDSTGTHLGYLFVFMDNILAIDQLTGFHNTNCLISDAREPGFVRDYPCAVVAASILHLSRVNSEKGRETGDEVMRRVAYCMRRVFGADAYYVRYDEVNLLAICPGKGLEQANEELAMMRNMVKSEDIEDLDIRTEGIVLEVENAAQDLLETVQSACNGVHTKKMLSRGTTSSSMLKALIATQSLSTDTSGKHLEHMKIMGEHLADRLGLSELLKSQLSLLCLLHDIGTVGVPVEILNKPGKLTDKEWEELCSHVSKGAQIAASAPELEDIAPCILHHHEHWDGSGYPDGLEGSAIPLLSRIVNIIDSYEAMITDRPYRQALTSAQARQELQKFAGVQFDPYIVIEFVRMLDEESEQIQSEQSTSPAADVQFGHRPRSIEATLPDPVDVPLKALDYTRFTVGSDGIIRDTNPAFEALTGYSDSDLEEYKLTFIDLFLPEDLPYYKEVVIQALSKDASAAFIEHRIRRKDGTARNVLCLGMARDGSTTIIMVDMADTKTVQDVTLRERESALRSLDLWQDTAMKDPLTGLLNREAYRTKVQTLMNDSENPLLMLMLDADHFKDYNDEFGHPEGDKLIKALATTLQTIVGKDGYVCRMGGDEFSAVIELRILSDSDEAYEAARVIRNQLNDAIKEISPSMSVSCGAALATGDAKAFNDLYVQADKALYEAKESGRDCLKCRF